MSGSRPFPLSSSLEPPPLPPLPPLRRPGVSVPYPWSPAARSRDALLPLWVLIMETKRVEIPGSVLDDLCRYRVAARCPGPLRPLLAFSHVGRPRGPPRLLPPPTPLSSLSGPAAPGFSCSTLPRTASPLSFRRSLPASHGLSSVLPRGAPECPHFLSSPTLAVLPVKPLRRSLVGSVFRPPPPPPIVLSCL